MLHDIYPHDLEERSMDLIYHHGSSTFTPLQQLPLFAEPFQDHGDKYRESERKFVPIDPCALDHLRENPDQLIEQIYLSHPDEPYSLRLRETTTSGGVTYTATLKDRGTIHDGVLNRLEIETEISLGAYNFFTCDGTCPQIHVMRSTIAPGVTVDFVEGLDVPIVEAETDDLGFLYSGDFPKLRDVTDQPSAQKEILAHKINPEAIGATSPKLDVMKIIHPILTSKITPSPRNPYIIAISGRSGSGKTTLAREVQELLQRFYSTQPRLSYEIPILSTDDYNVGHTALGGGDDINWDEPFVYNTGLMAQDILASISNGRALPVRRFDFAAQEPLEPIFPDGKLLTPVIIIEGIRAHSWDLRKVTNALYRMPTPRATCIGRRIMRDIGERRSGGTFGSPESMLRYAIEFTEPTFVKNQ